MGGEAYLLAAKLTGDPAIQAAVQGMLDYILKTAPRAPDGTLYHVFNNPQVWSDGFFSSPPFLAAAGQYDEALRPDRRLPQAPLESPEETALAHLGRRQAGFQRRGFLEFGQRMGRRGRSARHPLPCRAERKDDRARLAAFVKDIIDGCLAYQRPDGLFHDKMDKPDSFVETNAGADAGLCHLHGRTRGLVAAGICRQGRSHARRRPRQGGSVRLRPGRLRSPGFSRPGTSTEAQSFFIMMEAAGAKK